MPLVFLKWRVGEAVNTYAFHAYIHGFKSRTRHQLCLRPVDNKSGATPQVERLYVAVRNSIYQFEIEGDTGYISDLKEAPGLSDFEAMFILGRATMNFIDMCGTHKCRASLVAGEERLLKSIGFKENGGEYFSDMAGMFDGKCQGH